MPVLTGPAPQGMTIREAVVTPEQMRAGLVRQSRILLPPITGTADAPAVEAEVNHGRWIAHCASARCVGAELVSESDPRFWCGSCFNADFGGQALPVVFPAARAEIEALLLARPVPELMSWLPAETAADLERENADHAEGWPV